MLALSVGKILIELAANTNYLSLIYCAFLLFQRIDNCKIIIDYCTTYIYISLLIIRLFTIIFSKQGDVFVN